MSKSVKFEDQTESSPSSRIEALENDTASLKENVTKLLSVLTIQADQLSRQEVIISELRDEKRTKENRPLFVALFLMIILIVILSFVGIPNCDTVLHLRTLATPLKAPFITTGVKVQIRVGDVIESLKAAMNSPSSTAVVVRGR